MDSEGLRGPSNPSAMLASLLNKRSKLNEELRAIENQVYEMETSYLQDPSQCGNVLKGFEGFLSASKSTALLKRSRKFQPEDRLFSLSSITSPADLERTTWRFEAVVREYFMEEWRKSIAVRQNKSSRFRNGSEVMEKCEAFIMRRVTQLQAEELAGGRDDGRLDLGGSRSKGGVYANGQGKPKKGRPTPRDAKKHRPSDQDFDYEDDPDLTS